MQARRLILLLVAVLLLGMGLALIAYYDYYLQEYRTVPYDFTVKENMIGLDADKDALHFGAFSPGSQSQRFMNITPAQDARLVIAFSGNGSRYLSAEPNDVAVTKGEAMEVTFTAAAPQDAAQGNYSGVVKFYLYRR